MKTLATLVLVALIAPSISAQDEPRVPSLSEQAIQAAELRVRAERWGRVADQSLQAFGLASAAGLAMTGIADQHPQRTRAIDIAWIASGTVWLTTRLMERSLKKRAEALEDRELVSDRRP